jgi:MFS family permease
MSWKSRSYDAVPALSVRGQALRRALRTVTAAWMLGVVWMACVSGSHVKIFSRMLGFSDLTFGLMGALPFMATFGQVIAAALIDRTGLLKYQFIHCSLIHRLLWLVVAAVGLLLPVPSSWAVAVMLSTLAMSWFMAALSSPAWLTWMGCLIPRRIRGRYFAQRERLALTTLTGAVILLGILMDVVFDPAGPAYQALAMRTICAVFAVGAVFGTLDIVLFYKVPEVLPAPELQQGAALGAAEEKLYAEQPPPARGRAKALGPIALLRELLLVPLKDRVFRHYVFYGATMSFSITFAGWFFWLNAMDNLGFSSLAANALFLVIGPVAGILAAKGWGRAVDRWGRRPVLVVATVGTTFSILPWLLITRRTPAPDFAVDAAQWLLAGLGQLIGRADSIRLGPETPVGAYLLAALGCVIGGATWPGINLAQTGIVLGFADGTGSSRYIAASSVLISTGGMLGGLAGGVLTQSLQVLQDSPIRLGPLLWNNWHVAFGVALLARSLAILWLVGMPDPGAASVRSLIRSTGMNVYNNIVTRAFYVLRVFGWRKPSNGERFD